MTFAALREKYAGLAEQSNRHERLRDAVRDALAPLGLPMASALAEPVTLGRFWFSAWDAFHAPWCRLQRFEA